MNNSRLNGTCIKYIECSQLPYTHGKHAKKTSVAFNVQYLYIRYIHVYIIRKSIFATAIKNIFFFWIKTMKR